LGPRGEHHADQSMAALVMHINREVIAHGAEICLLRDLYRAQKDGQDPLVAAARRGDAAEVSRLLDGGAEVPPSLVAETAGLRHWDVVRALVERGVAVDVGNPSALHYAAAAGELEIVRLLLDHGADRELRDAQFGIAPGVWADHFGHAELAAYLLGDDTK
ncbi:MAG TPA: ankyrin repeat domain-containing protein, partial [Arachnia sp.]|nr:ankyrin repeat domain-containing protein [Arachnia sp.]